MSARVVLIDNRDSFAYNLVEALRRLGGDVEVHRNDRDPAALLARCGHDAVMVLSPGPGAPASAGCLLELVRRAHGRVPLLGICLGHQALVEALGGRVGRAPAPLHGRASPMRRAAHPALAGLPPTFPAGRYHSLAALALPEALEPIAWAEDGTVMAVAGRDAPSIGLQFHPESILTPDGAEILEGAMAWLTASPRRAVA